MALCSLLACGLAQPVVADEVGMRTTRAVGETLKLALNNGTRAELQWGDGTKESIVFTGQLQEIPVVADSLLLVSEGNITSLYCAGNELVSLNVREAKNLLTLVCNDNKLTALDLYNNRNLTSVDCQRNEISYFRMKQCTKLVSLNCAQNKLTALDLGSSLKQLTTLICAENELEALNIRYTTALQKLWCQENAIETLGTNYTVALKELYAFGNKLTALDLSKATELTDLWVDYNELDSLNLTANTKIVSVIVDHNRLRYIVSTSSSGRNLDYFYANDNQLTYISFPTAYSQYGKLAIAGCNVAPQNPFDIVPAISVGDDLDISAHLAKNAWAKTLNPDYTWKRVEDDTELVEDTDYERVKKGVFKFLNPVGDVYAEFAVKYYPDLTLRTTPVKVMTDATGVEDVTAGAESATIRVVDGQLVVTAKVPSALRVATVDGRLVLAEQVAAGTHRWTLPAGVYVVNGQKVLVGR